MSMFEHFGSDENIKSFTDKMTEAVLSEPRFGHRIRMFLTGDVEQNLQPEVLKELNAFSLRYFSTLLESDTS